MKFYNETVLHNSWAAVTMDFLIHEENREEVKEILNKMFSFDEEEAKKNRKPGYKRLKELKEEKIIECIDNGYYMMFGGVRE